MANKNRKKILGWLAGIMLTGLAFVFAEGSLMATSKIFGPFKATLIRVTFTIPLSWFAIYLASGFSSSRFLKAWYAKKEEGLSKTAKVAVGSGKAFAVLNTAIFLGPILATVLMIMLGIRGRRIYLYSAICAVVCAAAWCSFYSGLFWGIEKAFMPRT